MQLGGLDTTSFSALFSVARQAESAFRGHSPLATSGCVNQQIVSAPVINGDGSETLTTTDYYDTACTIKEGVVTVQRPVNNANAMSGTFPFTAKSYDRSQNATGYLNGSLTLTLQGTVTLVSFQFQAASSPNTSPIAQIGISCALSTNYTIGCAAASVTTVAGVQNGLAITANDEFTSLWPSATSTETLTSTLYDGPGLAIEASGLEWNVTGATAVDTLSGTIDESFAGSSISAGTVALSDTTHATSVAGTISASGTQLTVTQNGAPEATVAVDGFGNGTINYADGTTAAVAYWVVVG